MPTHVGIEKGRSASAHKTAYRLGCNYKKVEKVRRILKEGTDKIKKDVKKDKITINKAYILIVKKSRNYRHERCEAIYPQILDLKKDLGYPPIGKSLVIIAE